ncbi:hypothetical protein SQ11_10990 [Nitrosospira sp. NpAV]|nr:hypothetical protein SQ11_10990 [Nitrosospira sp. NpAV]
MKHDRLNPPIRFLIQINLTNIRFAMVGNKDAALTMDTRVIFLRAPLILPGHKWMAKPVMPHRFI